MKRFKLVFFIGLLICSQYISAQNKQRLVNNWEYLKGDLGGVWEAIRPVKEGNPESVPLWQNVKLPHCFNALNSVDPDENYYQGPGWYRTQLSVTNPYKDGRTLLHFEGAGQKTQVYIYDKKVAEHVGGYDEWTVDITDAVKAFKKSDVFAKQFKGKIPLEIRCDNSRDLEMIPSDLSDFNVYGGLYRYLNLVYVPKVSVDKIFAAASVDAKGTIGKLNISGRLLNPDGVDTVTVKIEIKDPEGKIVASWGNEMKAFHGDKALWETSLKTPKLWSPESPNLYTVQTSITAKGDTHIHQEKIGFRNFEFVKKGPFMLNGRRLLLRGTHRHEDHAGVAAAMTEGMIRQEILMMKDMGVNFIRLGHYQQSRIVLNLCDSLGIMVWEEIPWCRGGLGGDVYKNQARRMLTNMIEQHYNHAAVIIWGLGNENDWPGDFNEFDEQKIRTFMKELNDLSHTLDASRKTAIRRCDFCKDIVDVYSPSIWAGWYRGIYTEYKEASKKEFDRVDHFLHVEWGGDSHAGRHSETPDKALSEVKTGVGTDERDGDASLFGGSARVSKDGDWSESYIVNLIDWHLKEQENMPWLTGAAYWPFKDFSTPVRPDNPVPYMNQKGVIERDFTKKEAYYVFQSYWTQAPMIHIYGHSWPVRWGDAGEKKMVKVYSNCSEAELFLNGKSMGKKKRNSQNFPAAGLRWMVTYNEGPNHIKVIAKTKEGKEITDEITQEYQTAKWKKPTKLVLEKLSEKDNIAVIQVKLFDENNILCLDARDYVTFGLTGDGSLIDNQGTSDGSRKVQLYNGRAVISINLNKGKSVASVKADGLPVSFLTL
ncbi:MAG: glycoside hydrolase family 2 TIM barrel-domain containing protein [Candidatus Pedobacter colombiensis]|uniref:Glycoside hydrolase family 2 TIM barrel-domain containing protein n=1 Tax=Candidatus Pedobacter colombiensis TaxID=3121371 RepID=A0AAJ5W3T5_9SPHI|nr:glycoside hydrolase family 2 TIM barrel-domain containing protein [Pedobacter sp.]WEK17631.1 MAG: glycoside hydrolase family 2 TIM barrel-domain containing protein [Pedobacter sp.]